MAQSRAAAWPASGETSAPELALVGVGELAVRPEAELARDDDQVAGAHEGHVIRDGRRRARQRDAEFLQASISIAPIALLRATLCRRFWPYADKRTQGRAAPSVAANSRRGLSSVIVEPKETACGSCATAVPALAAPRCDRPCRAAPRRPSLAPHRVVYDLSLAKATRHARGRERARPHRLRFRRRRLRRLHAELPAGDGARERRGRARRPPTCGPPPSRPATAGASGSRPIPTMEGAAAKKLDGDAERRRTAASRCG